MEKSNVKNIEDIQMMHKKIPYCGHIENTTNPLCKICKNDERLTKMIDNFESIGKIPDITKTQIILGMNQMLTCKICSNKINKESSSIQCSNCFSIFHYKCIPHNDIDYCDCGWCNDASINCQICKMTFQKRNCLECYCRKTFYLEQKKVFKFYGTISTLEEKCSGYSNEGEEIPIKEFGISNSCSQICDKKLCQKKTCELICHPGPHMICDSHEKLMCYCGKKIIQDRICNFTGDWRFLSCGKQCGFKVCNLHSSICLKTCHSENDSLDSKKNLPNDGHTECAECLTSKTTPN